MGWKEKYIYGEAGISDLVLGLISIFMALGTIIFAYGGMLGKQSGDQIVFDMTLEKFSSTILTIWLGILFFGIIGGFEIGKYIQTEFNKRKRKS